MAEAGRVIGGSAKGIRLLAPPGTTRPLTDRVKQSLFAALVADGAVGEGLAFLDLFAGSGAAGIEALSHGARLAVMVEKDRRACDVISANLERARVAGGVVVQADVLRFLRAGGGRAGGRAGDARAGGGPFDAVLVDPPYGDPLEPVLGELGSSVADWLTTSALVVAKHFWRDEPAPAAGALRLERQKRFGETMLTFYRYQP